jgi:peptide-methionine (S)-S-oxide reductase
MLEIFFTIHDPTTLNRQGNDVGTQYRSVIYYQSAEQEKVARKVLAEMAGVWDAPIVTELAPAQPYYRPRTTTRITSSSIRCRATAPSWWRPRWRNSAMYAHRLK